MTKRILNLKPSVFIALGLTIAVVAWMWSGQLQSDVTAPEVAVKVEEDAQAPLVQVRVMQSIAKDHQAVIIVSGRTEEDRSAEISAETDGRFISVDMQEGQAVAKGQVIAKISVDGRHAILEQAKALVEQRQLEFEAATKLADKGFQSKTKKSASAADLSAAKAALVSAQIDLNNTIVVAPFNGVIKYKHIEVGDYAQRGDPLAEIISLNPLYVTGHVAEKEIGHVTVGSQADVKLITGQTLTGILTRIAPISDDATRTFKIEVKIDNSHGLIQAGLTAEFRLPLETVSAHLITPALLSLNDDGDIGVKTVTRQGVVIFNKIMIIEDTIDGLWVAGLPIEATVISVGQEYVIHGQQVETIADDRMQGNQAAGNAS